MSFPLIFSRIFAVLGAIPLIVFGLLSAGYEARNFFDPCYFFADTPGGNPLPAGCHNSGGTTETRSGAVFHLILIQGTALALAAAGLIGGFRPRSQLVLGTSLCLFVLTVTTGGGTLGLISVFAALSFLASFLFIFADRRMQSS